MHTTLTVTTAPKAEPVSLEIAKAHLRVDSGNEDELVAMYLQSARGWAEGFLGRALITQTLLWTMKREPTLGMHSVRNEWWWWGRSTRHEAIELPRAPVQSVGFVKYVDDLGVAATIDPANYTVDTALEPARLVIDWDAVSSATATSIAWPLRHLQVQFVAGYGADGTSVPPTITNGILLLTAFLYEHRGDAGGDMPPAAERLLWMHRIAFL